MLRELVMRDWTLHRRALIPIFAIFAAFQVYFVLRVDSARFWLVFTGLYAAFLTIIPFSREDKFGATAWTCTLPVTRRQIVRARFVEAWLLFVGWSALSVTMAVSIPGSAVPWAKLWDPSGILLAVAVVAIVLSLLLPFTIRFGLLGVMVFLVAAQVLGAVALVIATLRGSGAGKGGDPIRTVIEGTRSGLSLGYDTLTPIPFYLVVIAVLAAFHWTAYRVAVALFRRKEL